MRRVLVALALMVFVCGCSAFGRQATAVVVIDRGNEQPPITVYVYDDSGLVAGAQRLDTSGAGFEGGARVSNDQMGIDVQWVGGECRREPTIVVSTASDRIQIDVNVDDSRDLLVPISVACSAVGILLGVHLQTISPVTPDSVTLKLHPS